MKNCPSCKQPIKLAEGGDPEEELDNGEGSMPTDEEKKAMAENGEGSMPSAEDEMAVEGKEATPEDVAAAVPEGGEDAEEDDEEDIPKPTTKTPSTATPSTATPSTATPKPGQRYDMNGRPIPPPPSHAADEPVSAANTIVVTGHKRPDYVGTGGGDYNMGLQLTPPPPLTPEVMNAEDLGFASDLHMGKITPKTYHSLFEEKSTLGKVGTLFGLLLSGAGSGLAHQPNALMEMMNREIDRDLDAQKASNTNAQNWYHLSLNHELQKAQMNKMLYENANSLANTEHALAGAYHQATSADFERGKIEKLGGKTFDLTASNAARNRMMLASQQHMQNMVNTLPPGPTKVSGQNVLDTTVKPAIQSQIDQNNKKTGAQLGLLNRGGGGMGPTIDPGVYGKHLQQQKAAAAAAQAQKAAQGAINYGKLNQMIQGSRNNAALGLPPTLTESDIGAINEEAKDIEANRVAAAMYNHAFTVLNSNKAKSLHGITDELYKAETGTLGPEIARATAGRFNMAEAEKQSGGLFPTFEDFISGAGPEKYRNAMTYFRGKEKGTSTLNRHPELKTPFPNLQSPFSTNLKEGQKGKDAKGKPTVVRDGKVVYQ